MGDEWTVVGKKAGGGKRGKNALSLKAAEALNAAHAVAWEAGGGADGDDGDCDATAQAAAVATTEQRIERALLAVRAAPFFRALTAVLRRHCHNVAAAAAEAADGSTELEMDPAPLQVASYTPQTPRYPDHRRIIHSTSHAGAGKRTAQPSGLSILLVQPMPCTPDCVFLAHGSWCSVRAPDSRSPTATTGLGRPLRTACTRWWCTGSVRPSSRPSRALR
jgi:hypothetical protein